MVGAGVAGLTAAYLLQRRYDVTLFEAEDRLGGHAHTHDVVTPDAGAISVDTGFIVFNRVTYPHLLRLFRELDVPSRATEMSMSISCRQCGLQYAGGKGVTGILAQPRALTDRRFLRMLTEIRRFHREARHVEAHGDDTMTLADFLTRGGYSPYFTAHFLIPMVAAVWSTSPARALDYPARYLFAFLANHGMLSVNGSHPWRTVVGGSRTYVERAVKQLTAVEVSTPVRAVSYSRDGVEIRDDADELHRFDRVVLATHADTSLRLLAHPTDLERRVLGAFEYSENDTVLHSDARVLPTVPRARASWNYRLPDCSSRPDRVLVSYDMKRLQHLPTAVPHLVTLNARDEIDAESVKARMRYTHPLYTRQSVAAQRHLPELTNDRIAFAGAYHGWGFHEDGARSGVMAAEAFGVSW